MDESWRRLWQLLNMSKTVLVNILHFHKDSYWLLFRSSINSMDWYMHALEFSRYIILLMILPNYIFIFKKEEKVQFHATCNSLYQIVIFNPFFRSSRDPLITTSTVIKCRREFQKKIKSI